MKKNLLLSIIVKRRTTNETHSVVRVRIHAAFNINTPSRGCNIEAQVGVVIEVVVASIRCGMQYQCSGHNECLFNSRATQVSQTVLFFFLCLVQLLGKLEHRRRDQVKYAFTFNVQMYMDSFCRALEPTHERAQTFGPLGWHH